MNCDTPLWTNYDRRKKAIEMSAADELLAVSRSTNKCSIQLETSQGTINFVVRRDEKKSETKKRATCKRSEFTSQKSE